MCVHVIQFTVVVIDKLDTGIIQFFARSKGMAVTHAEWVFSAMVRVIWLVARASWGECVSLEKSNLSINQASRFQPKKPRDEWMLLFWYIATATACNASRRKTNFVPRKRFACVRLGILSSGHQVATAIKTYQDREVGKWNLYHLKRKSNAIFKRNSSVIVSCFNTSILALNKKFWYLLTKLQIQIPIWIACSNTFSKNSLIFKNIYNFAHSISIRA